MFEDQWLSIAECAYNGYAKSIGLSFTDWQYLPKGIQYAWMSAVQEAVNKYTFLSNESKL